MTCGANLKPLAADRYIQMPQCDDRCASLDLAKLKKFKDRNGRSWLHASPEVFATLFEKYLGCLSVTEPAENSSLCRIKFLWWWLKDSVQILFSIFNNLFSFTLFILIPFQGTFLPLVSSVFPWKGGCLSKGGRCTSSSSVQSEAESSRNP